MNRRFDEAAADVNRRFDEAAADVNRRFDEVDYELRGLGARIDGLHQTLMVTGGGIIAALLGVIVTQL